MALISVAFYKDQEKFCAYGETQLVTDVITWQQIFHKESVTLAR